jgi:hypoxanthine-DNA glycosylase
VPTSRKKHLARSFPPIVAKNADTLILGSSPGVASLDAKEYYAYRQNTFWRILSDLYDMPVATYRQKRAIILKNRLALWDVLKECLRVGSGDNKISRSVPNKLEIFFERHRTIRRVFLNGNKAAAEFERLYKNFDKDLQKRIKVSVLPSTSPAHARLRYPQKRKLWAVLKKS